MVPTVAFIATDPVRIAVSIIRADFECMQSFIISTYIHIHSGGMLVLYAVGRGSIPGRVIPKT